MQTKQELLLDLLGTPDVRFSIPAYQRTYAWTDQQCDELWRDIFRAARVPRSHFIGMVICTDEPRPQDDCTVRCIVDGQQRLATVSIMLLAFSHYMAVHGIDFFGMDAQLLRESYLICNGNLKLDLSRADKDTWKALVTGTDLPARASTRMIANYRRFSDKMAEPGFDPDLFWRGLRSLLAISAKLGPHDNPQAIFQSLNSKGVPLTTADMVRNYLLMAQSRREQTRLYQEYWEPIQGAFGDDPGSVRLNNAIRAWLQIRCKTAKSKSDRNAFSTFKIFCEEEFHGTAEELLSDLRGFAMVWAENFRYHAVKKYRTYDWATIGPKTLVSDRPLKLKPENREAYEFYRRHYGINGNVSARW